MVTLKGSEEPAPKVGFVPFGKEGLLEVSTVYIYT